MPCLVVLEMLLSGRLLAKEVAAMLIFLFFALQGIPLCLLADPDWIPAGPRRRGSCQASERLLSLG